MALTAVKMARHGPSPSVPRRRGGRASCTAQTPGSWMPGWTCSAGMQRPRRADRARPSAEGRAGRALLLRELHRQGRLSSPRFRLGDRRHRGTTQAAVAAAPISEQSRAGMAEHRAHRYGRSASGVCCSSPSCPTRCCLRKRADSAELFAFLFGQHGEHDAARTTSGSRRLHTSWSAVCGANDQRLAGRRDRSDADQLIDQLAAILDELADPELYFD